MTLPVVEACASTPTALQLVARRTSAVRLKRRSSSGESRPSPSTFCLRRAEALGHAIEFVAEILRRIRPDFLHSAEHQVIILVIIEKIDKVAVEEALVVIYRFFDPGAVGDTGGVAAAAGLAEVDGEQVVAVFLRLGGEFRRGSGSTGCQYRGGSNE